MPRLPLPMSLRGRLIAWVAGVSALLVIAASLGTSAVLQRQFDAAVDQGLTERAADVAAAWRPGGPTELADPFAQVVATNGEVLARSVAAPGYSIVARSDLVDLPAAGTRINTALPALRGHARLFARPAHGDVVVVAAPLEALDSARGRLQREILAALAVLVLALLGVTWILVGAALRPVGRMTRAADRLLAGPTRSGELPVPAGNDELTRLAGTLNRLLMALAAVIDRERALVDDASHELRTPLSTLSGELELALDEPDPDLRREGMERALGQARRMSALADDLLVLARETSGTGRPRQQLDLVPWLTDAVRDVLPPVVRVTVHADARDGPRSGSVAIAADPLALDRVVGNVLRNAAAAGALAVDIHVWTEEASVFVAFADDGTGLPPDGLVHAFDRFYRADSSRPQPIRPSGTSGAGLGLPIVKAVVEAHGGSAKIRNAAHADGTTVGAVVELRFPMIDRNRL